MFLSVNASVMQWLNDRRTFSLVFDDNALGQFVQLPEGVATTLWYSNVLCGGGGFAER